MDFNAIYHRPTQQMCYMLSEDEVVINIKTGNDVDSVRLIYADPYLDPMYNENPDDFWGNYMDMTFDKQLRNQKWWTATVRPKWKRLKYHFEIEGNSEKYYLFEEGILTSEVVEGFGNMITDFKMPWMNPADINRPPEWAADTVWYHIFPDRFCKDSNAKPEKDITPWREEGTAYNNERFGGNLKGIIEKLDYISELGISGIYLMPVFKSSSIHNYETDDYYHVDPSLGTDSDLKNLVKKAHSLGIRVMIDGVFNHSGKYFAPWQDVLKKGKRSKYFDWFFINTWPIDTTQDTMDGGYYTFAFFAHMPKLNTNNEEVISYFEKVCTKWVEKYDIDGIRIDAGNEVSHYFLKRINRTLKAVRPDIFLLCESWHDSIGWLEGDEFDSVTNYIFATITGSFFLLKDFSRKDFEYGINENYIRYMEQTNRVLFNLLDSHDTNRLITRCGSFDNFIQQLAILLTMPGSPCIYYGTEIGLEGGHDPDCRRCMPWKKIESGFGTKYKELVSSLIHLRNEEMALRSLKYRFTDEYDERRLIEYVRTDEDGRSLQVLVNGSENDVEIRSDGEDILFSNGFDGGALLPGGTLIRRHRG